MKNLFLIAAKKRTRNPETNVMAYISGKEQAIGASTQTSIGAQISG